MVGTVPTKWWWRWWSCFGVIFLGEAEFFCIKLVRKRAFVVFYFLDSRASEFSFFARKRPWIWRRPIALGRAGNPDGAVLVVMEGCAECSVLLP